MGQSDRIDRDNATARSAAMLAVLLMLAGCAGREPVPPEPAAETTRPAIVDRATATPYRVDTRNSILKIYVYRAGALARLGHNHVLATRDLEGTIWYRDDAGRSAFQIGFPVESLTIDEPELRAEAGAQFPGEIPAEDIAGTRANLLGDRVLDAAAHPRIEAELLRVSGEPPSLVVTAAVTIRGERRPIELPVTVTMQGERLIAEGEGTVSHSRLGLTAFSVMGGALSVADEIDLAWRIEARREAP